MFLNRSRQAPAEDTPAFGGVAERFRRAGDLDRAIALCREGLKKFPLLLSARVTLGWALLDKGEYEEARVELEQVLRRAPDNLAAIRGLAELHDRAENQLPSMEHGAEWQQSPAVEVATAAEDAEEAEAVSEMLSRLGLPGNATGSSDDVVAATQTAAASPGEVTPAVTAQPAPAPIRAGGMTVPDSVASLHAGTTEPVLSAGVTSQAAPVASHQPVTSIAEAGLVEAKESAASPELAISAAPADLATPVAPAKPDMPALAAEPTSAPPEIVFTNSAGVMMPAASRQIAESEPSSAASSFAAPTSADSPMPVVSTPAAEFEAFEVGPPAVYEFTNSAGVPFVPAAAAQGATEPVSETPVVLDVEGLPPAAFDPAPVVASEVVAAAHLPEADAEAIAAAADAAPVPAMQVESAFESVVSMDEIDPELPPAAPALIDSPPAVSFHGIPADQPGAIEDDIVALPAVGEIGLEELASSFANELQLETAPEGGLESAPPTPIVLADPSALEALQPDGLLEMLSPDASPSMEAPAALSRLEDSSSGLLDRYAEPAAAFEILTDSSADLLPVFPVSGDVPGRPATEEAAPPHVSDLTAPLDAAFPAASGSPGASLVAEPEPTPVMAVPQVVPITHVSRRAAQIAALEKFLRQVETRRLQLSAGSVA